MLSACMHAMLLEIAVPAQLGELRTDCGEVIAERFRVVLR